MDLLSSTNLKEGKVSLDHLDSLICFNFLLLFQIGEITEFSEGAETGFLINICNLTCYKHRSKDTDVDDLLCRFKFPKELSLEFKILIEESTSLLNEKRYKLNVFPTRETRQVRSSGI